MKTPRAAHPRHADRGRHRPGGEEIFTDKYGRIKVQFHWDRQGKKDEHSSCWVRVAQSWAGRSLGTRYLPRIGQEVVVAFVEGDPDRPLVVGSRLQCRADGAVRAAGQQDPERAAHALVDGRRRRRTATSSASRTRRARSWSSCMRRRTCRRRPSTTRRTGWGTTKRPRSTTTAPRPCTPTRRSRSTRTAPRRCT